MKNEYLWSLTATFWVIIIHLFSFIPAQAQGFVRDIVFPIDGPYQPFSDNFSDPRSGGRMHGAIDIVADKMTPLVAVADGTISKLVIPEALWGYAIYLDDDEGYTYAYLHVNNDNPGTDDGDGGIEHAYAPGIARGSRVARGQLVGWLGDSGNAENVTDHLHFEMYDPTGARINPYDSLVAASNNVSFSYEAESLLAPTINEDKNLVPGETVRCVSGELIKTEEFDSVYYCGADGRRYVFPNAKVYASWYDDFFGVKVIPSEDMGAILLGGNVTYRPGSRLVKITTDPKVYAVAHGGMLRWVTSPELAVTLFGAGWQKQLEDIPDAFFTNYAIGEPIY